MLSSICLEDRFSFLVIFVPTMPNEFIVQVETTPLIASDRSKVRSGGGSAVQERQVAVGVLLATIN